MKLYWDTNVSLPGAAPNAIDITTYSLTNNELLIEASREADLYRVYTQEAMAADEADKVIAGTNSAGDAVLSYGPDRLQFGETLAVDDNISSLADNTWHVNTVAVAVNDGVKSDVQSLSFDKASTFAVVSATTGSPTITTDVSIDGGTYDVYDFLDDGSITFSAAGIVEARYVGPGGTGGDRAGGGGSAGGFFERILDTTGGVEVLAQEYPIVVGDNGNFVATSFAGLTARTGANGGTIFSSGPEDGPSGGGGSADDADGGVATPGEDAGFDGVGQNTNENRGGGGGGKGGPGIQGATNRGGRGGSGVESNFDGTPTMFAAGGGAGGINGFGGSGIGGDGANANDDGASATTGATNTGSGGGGGQDSGDAGAAGGSGRFTLRIRTA